MSDLFPELDPLARGLNAAVLRHKVIAANLANQSTPGFVRNDVKFEELLRAQLGSKQDPGSFRQAALATAPKVVSDPSGPATPDGNNVTIERETGQLNRNEILYNVYSEILSMKINQIRFVISNSK